MSHPSREEWVAFLYGESDPESDKSLTAHLQVCRQCQESIATWRGVMAELDAWQLPRRPTHARQRWRIVRAAAAAILLIALGVTLGRFTAPRAPDGEALRTSLEASLTSSLEPAIRQRLRRDFDELAVQLAWALNAATDLRLAEFLWLFDAARAEDRQVFGVVLEGLESQRLSDQVQLRNDLVQLAALTGDELLRTKQDVVRLILYGQPLVPVPDGSEGTDSFDEGRSR